MANLNVLDSEIDNSLSCYMHFFFHACEIGGRLLFMNLCFRCFLYCDYNSHSLKVTADYTNFVVKNIFRLIDQSSSLIPERI